MPTIRILLFAGAAEALGVNEVNIEVGERASAGDVVDLVAKRCAGAGALLDRSAVAVNERYATRSTPVQQGDVVAIIPPVSGG
jgi:molybdopterin converting factor subunit 1